MINAKAVNLKIPSRVKKHVATNIKEYIIITLIFLLGIFFGVIYVNNMQIQQKEEVSKYINNYIDKEKENKTITTSKALKNSIKDNTILAIGLWFAGTTIIGIPIVLGTILFRGFCLGYTISSCTYTMGLGKGIAFTTVSIVLQNILFIPAILALGVSGLKLYKSIVKDRRKENIKVEVLRHTIFSAIMLLILIISAVIKINISGNMLQNLIKYF